MMRKTVYKLPGPNLHHSLRRLLIELGDEAAVEERQVPPVGVLGEQEEVVARSRGCNVQVRGADAAIRGAGVVLEVREAEAHDHGHLALQALAGVEGHERHLAAHHLSVSAVGIPKLVQVDVAGDAIADQPVLQLAQWRALAFHSETGRQHKDVLWLVQA